MLKKVLSDSVVYGASRVLMMAVGMFLIPVYSRLFTTAEYGIIETFNIFMNVALLILPCGLFQSIYRFVYESKDEEQHVRIYSAIFSFFLVFALSVMALMLLFRYPLTQLLINDTNYLGIYQLSLLTITFSLFSSYNLEILRSQYKKFHYLIIAVGTGVTLACGGIFFVVVLKKGIYGFFYASVLSQGLFCLVGLFFNRRWLKFSLAPGLLKDLLHFGLPFIPAGLTLMLMKFGDRFFVQRMMGLNDLGLYSMGVRISSLYDIVGMAFSLALFPHIMRIVHEPGSHVILKRFLIQTLVLLGFSVAFFSIVAKPVLYLLADKKFWECSHVIYPFVLSSACASLNYVLGLGIYASKKTKYIFIPTLLGGVLNLVLCFVLVKPLGIVGAALSSLVGSVVYLVSSYFIAQKLYPIDYDLAKAVTIITSFIGWTSLIFYLDDYVTLSTATTLFIKFVMLGVAVAAVFGFGLIDFKNVRASFSKRAVLKQN